MKTLFYLFFVCYIETFVVAEDDPLQTGFILKRSQKKKNDNIVHKNLDILNGRYLKIPEGKASVDLKTNQDVPMKNADAYTVFLPIHAKGANVDNLPDSPYFPSEKYTDYKPRVKKVLPEVIFQSAIRQKRAAAQPTAKKAVKMSEKDKNNSKNEEADHKKVKDDKKENAPTKLKSAKRQAKSSRFSVKSKATDKSQSGAKPKRKHKKKSNKLRKRDGKKNGKKGGRSHRRRSTAAKPGRRLIASNDAAVEDYPYTISIQKDRQHWCSGALLNPRLAITTANCLWKSERLSRMRIRACSRYTNKGGQEAMIQEVMKHPQWSIRRRPDHDLALIYLDRMISFSDKCHGVDLPNRIMYPVFEDAWITSWGAERRDGIYERPLTMQVYHANLIDRVKCHNITMRFGVPVTANFICLAQTGRRAPCTRDTGAPAVSDGVLWGLASWGIRKLCGTERFPAMFSFTASTSNMDFISNATTYLMSEQRLNPYPDRYPFEFTRKSTLTQSGADPTTWDGTQV